MRFAIVIMAAGRGTRLRSKRAKVLHEIGGKTLLRHVVDAARSIVPVQDIYVVIGHQASQVEASLIGLGVKSIHQTELRGTGHAIQQAAKAMSEYDDFIVLSGDSPLIQPEDIVQLRDFHLARKAAMSLLTATPKEPFGYGRVIRKTPESDEVTAIVEQGALTPEQAELREINAGCYAFTREPLYAHIGKLQANNTHSELYLTDMAAILAAAGERVVALRTGDSETILGANTMEALVQLDTELRRRNAQRLMEKGVTIYRPETTVIDSGVTVGSDTVIEPFVQLLGETKIGEDCRIRSFSVLESATLGSGVLVRNGCLIIQSEIHDGAMIGPYAHLRPESEIGENAHVGNFVETKKVRLGKGSKANHLSYLGDAEIGAGVNVGAGVITCNYDGNSKNRTVIGDEVFVGSDSTLVAPLTLGKGAYIAAGSAITEDVPEDALALGRARQTVKKDWAKARRARK